MTPLRQAIEALRAVDTVNPHHPEVNQFNHTVQVVLQAEARLPRVPEQHRADFLRAAALHDVGKAVTVERQGNTHGHEAESVALIEGTVPEAVTFLVKNHLRIMHLPVMRPGKRAALEAHPLFPVLAVLREADLAGRQAGFELTSAVQGRFYAILADIGL